MPARYVRLTEFSAKASEASPPMLMDRTCAPLVRVYSMPSTIVEVVSPTTQSAMRIAMTPAPGAPPEEIVEAVEPRRVSRDHVAGQQRQRAGAVAAVADQLHPRRHPVGGIARIVAVDKVALQFGKQVRRLGRVREIVTGVEMGDADQRLPGADAIPCLLQLAEGIAEIPHRPGSRACPPSAV